MEHSWWLNREVGKVCELLHRAPLHVAWVGDYADDVGCDPLLYEARRDAKNGLEVPFEPLLLDGKFLVNHTKEEFVDCDAYKKRAAQADGWCIHPLPLLTAIGNGEGGGDYFGKSSRNVVGRWANDVITVEDVRPALLKELVCTFIED